MASKLLQQLEEEHCLLLGHTHPVLLLDLGRGAASEQGAGDINSGLEVFHVQADFLMAETTPYKERSLKNGNSLWHSL